jgi:hypothetical protein
MTYSVPVKPVDSFWCTRQVSAQYDAVVCHAIPHNLKWLISLGTRGSAILFT